MVHQSTGADVDGNLSRDLVNKGLHKSALLTDASTNEGISQLSTPSPHRSISRKSKQKISEVGSFLSKVGSTGLGKAVEALDTLGSSMTNLHFGSGFVSGVAKGNRISILAFEVANTIVKGANLMQAFSEDNITHLKEVVLPSEGVQRLTSEDMDELLRIAAADKRLGSELPHQKQLKEETENVMHELLASVQYTAALYHELNALDRFEQDYRRKILEASERGESLSILRAEWNCQKKHIKHLKKKSLWSKILDEVARSSSVPSSSRDALHQGFPPSIKSALRFKLQSYHHGEGEFNWEYQSNPARNSSSC